MSLVVNDTPVIEYRCGQTAVLVKREDLCAPAPGPAFSKMRGVYAHIANRPERVIGVLDTYHSKAGWAVAYACQALGKQAVNYWPHYKDDSGTMRQQQQTAQSMGAEMVSLPAGRSAVLYHRAKHDLRTRHNGAYMMPNALKLAESVEENAAEARRTVGQIADGATVVVSISSGTVAAGVIRGFIEAEKPARFVLHMGYSRPEQTCRAYIERAVGVLSGMGQQWTFVDEGYDYGDAVDVAVPFPCNPYYDAKAWKWMSSAPIEGAVFWNIGA